MTRRRLPRTGWAIIGAATMFGITGAINAAMATSSSSRTESPSAVPTATTVVDQGQVFHPIDPVRILNSRPGAVNTGTNPTPWGPNETRTVQIAGRLGIPTNATGVVLNVTVDNTTAWSFLTIWPADEGQPDVSNINWIGANETIANQTTVKLGPNGDVKIFNAFGSTNVLADIAGYYTPADFVPLPTTTTTPSTSSTSSSSSSSSTSSTAPI